MAFPIADLYDFILPHVPAVDAPIVNHAVVRAVRMIASQTAIQRASITVPTVVGQREYTVPPTAGNEIDTIIAVRLFPAADPNSKGIRLYPITTGVAEEMQWFDDALPTSWSYVADKLSLYPAPDSVNNLSVTVIMRPELDSAADLDDVYFHHREVIADGAMAFLFAMPAKPWTNQQAAQEAYARFGRAILALRARNRAGGQVNNGTLKGVRFGA